MVATHYKPTDAELVRQTLSGDRHSFDALVDRYRHQVFRLAYFKVRHAEEAEDMAQNAFVAAYQSLAQLREYDRFAPWLRRVAENTCNMSLRRGRIETVPLEDYQAHADDVTREIEKRLLHSQVHEAISKLSEANRLTAMLFFADGLSQREIAEFLDVPVGTVKRRINLSRTQLKKEMIEMVKDSFKDEKPKPDFTAKVAAKIDVMRWYKLFGEYIDAGINLVRSLLMLENGDFTDEIRQETLAVRTAIEQGEHLSRAIAAHAPSLNHPLVVGLVRCGEIGGNLEKSLETIVAWMEQEDMSLKVDTSYWLRTFSLMLTSGVPILQAIDTMKSVAAREPLGQLPDKLKAAVYKGGIYEPLQDYPELFSPAVVALIRAGERLGMLDSVIIQAAAQTMKEAYEQMQNDPLLAMGAHNIGPLVEEFRRQMQSQSADDRLGALQALEQTAGDKSSPDLIAALTDSDPRIRVMAAKLLEKHPVPEASEPLMRFDEPSPDVREACLRTLAVIDLDKTIHLIESAGFDSAAGVRKTAIQILASAKRPSSAGLLVQALQDEERLISHRAMEALKTFGEPARQPLLEAVNEPSFASRNLALFALDAIDPAAARDCAHRFLKENAPGMHYPSLHVIAKQENPEDVPLLIEAVSDSDCCVVRDAIESLGRMRKASAVPALIKALDHKETWLAVRAANSLGNIGDKSAIPALAAKLSTYNNPHLVGSIIDALAAMDAREYAGKALDIEFGFARARMSNFAMRSVVIGAVQLAGEPEIKRVVDALSDPELAKSAVSFLGWLCRKREDGIAISKSVGAVPALIQVIETADTDFIYAIVHPLVSMVGSEETVRLIQKAASAKKLSKKQAEKAIEIVETMIR